VGRRTTSSVAQSSIGEPQEERGEPAGDEQSREDEPRVRSRRRMERDERGERIERLRLHCGVERESVSVERIPERHAVLAHDDAVLDGEPRLGLETGRRRIERPELRRSGVVARA
jgi:hypothetical protein